MGLRWWFYTTVALTAINWAEGAQTERVVCYYDSRSKNREGKGNKMFLEAYETS